MNWHARLTAASLVLVAILGVAGAAWLAGPNEDPLTTGVSPQEATPSPSPTLPGTATEESQEAPTLDSVRIATYEVFLSRDPFEPVIVSTAPVTSPPDDGSPPTTSPTTSPTTAPTTSPTTAPTTSPTTGPSPSPTGSDAPSDECVDNGAVVCDGQTVSLVDVFDNGQPGAVVRVDETLYEVRAGEAFATNFQVVSVDPPCATLLFGDDAFTLCEGETTLK